MSLGSLSSKAKTAVKDIASGNFKSIAMNVAIGVSLGAIASLLMHYLQLFVINKYAGKYAKIDGFSIYPNSPVQAMYMEDILLVIVTVGLLFTKKMWLTVGFFVGWYVSNYMGLYTALKLPQTSTAT